MKKIILLSAFISFSVTSAQSSWQKFFGGSEDDVALSIQNTTDGGYVIAGYSESNDGDVTGNNGYYDYWVLKLDSSGTFQWQKSLGGSYGDYARDIRQTTDGGYIIAGGSGSFDGDVSENHGEMDYWIVKLDENGSIQWERSLPGRGYDDEACSIQQTTDGGYIVAGYSESNDGNYDWDYGIVKLDENGSIQWQRFIGGSGDDSARSVQQTSDGGYIIAGKSNSNDGDVTENHGDDDYWIVKLDGIGSIQWQKSYGGSGHDGASSIRQTTDGGYIVVGESRSNDVDVVGNHGYADFWIVKIDSIGSIQWQKSLGGSQWDRARDVQQTTDGGYIIAGSSNSNDGDLDGGYRFSDNYWIVKLNEIGIIQWQNSLDGNNSEYATSVQQTTDGGYIVAGKAFADGDDDPEHHGRNDFWVVKVTADGTMGMLESQSSKINLYPNPVKDVLHFSEEVSNIKITDVSGRMVKEISVSGKSVDVSGLAKGVYMITATSKSGKVISEKFIK